MKKQYIQPNTMHQFMCSISTICVGSIHGESGLKFGGAADPTDDSGPKPM